MPPATDAIEKLRADDDRHYGHLPVGYSDEKPFRMSEPGGDDPSELEDLNAARAEIFRPSIQPDGLRQRFFGAVLLALPLSVFLWVLAYIVF